jgi:hypothetical protein
MNITKKRILALLTTAMVLLSTLLPAMTVSAAGEDVYAISKAIEALNKTTSVVAIYTYTGEHPDYGYTTVVFNTSDGQAISVDIPTDKAAEDLADGIEVEFKGVDLTIALSGDTVTYINNTLTTDLGTALYPFINGGNDDNFETFVGNITDPIIYLAVYQAVHKQGLTPLYTIIPLIGAPRTATLVITQVESVTVNKTVSANLTIEPSSDGYATDKTDSYTAIVTPGQFDIKLGNLTAKYDLGDGEKTLSDPTAPFISGYTFGGYYADSALSVKLADSSSGIYYVTDTTVYAKFTKNPDSTPDYSGSSGSGSSGGNTVVIVPEIKKPEPTPVATDTTTPATSDPTTPATTEETAAPVATPAADVVVDSEITEEGTMTLTIGNKEIETASTSAATVIAAGEASEVITSGNAVAVVTTDNAVIAGANASGSMNSASTVAALTAAAANLEADETEVVIAAGEDVTVVSAATIRKLAAAAEEAGVTATLTAAATDETGAEVATIDIPLSAKTKTSIKTGLILEDESIDAAVASLEASSGNTVLASIKTEQKTSFGVKVAFSFDTAALGLDDAAEGDTYYVAIKRGDGKTVQVKATIVDGKLVFETASAGVMMISDKSFTK